MEVSTDQQTAAGQSPLAHALRVGAKAGLCGGLAFGMMMAMMGTLPMVGMMVGAHSAVLGFVIHMGISTIVGASYGIVACRLPSRTERHLVAGALNGVVWWVLGALVAMPLALGMNEMVLIIGPSQVMSLAGHLGYGFITAYVFNRLYRRP